MSDDYITGNTKLTARQAFWIVMPTADYKRQGVHDLLKEWTKLADGDVELVREAIKWGWFCHHRLRFSVPSFIEHNKRGQ